MDKPLPIHSVKGAALVLSLFFILLTSCGPQKEIHSSIDSDVQKSIELIDAMVQNQSEISGAMKKRLEILEQKYKDFRIEESTYNRLKATFEDGLADSEQKIESLKQERNRLLGIRDNKPPVSLLNTKKNTEYKANSDITIANVLKNVEESGKETLENLESYMLSDALLEKDLKREFELSVFFPAGVYEINEGDYSDAKTAFQPLIDEISEFVNAYPNRKLVIKIVTKGYADGQRVNPQSSLGKKLTTILGPMDDSKDMNKGLSRLRAEEISGLLGSLMKDAGLGTSSNHILELKPIGMGETLPNPTITDYQEDDRRRRIVSVFWDVFPM